MYAQVFSAAKEVDQAFLIILGFSVFIMVFVTGLMLWFLYRYHHKRHPVAADIEGNIWAEILWTVIPTIIVMGLFWTGWSSFKAMRTIPEGAMVVQAEGRMWSWKFTYETGKTSEILVVPVDTPVKLELSAKDVIHSFYVPAMRLKWDMVPGMDTDAWFESDAPGEFDIFCAEYCGLKHSNMVTTLRVVSPEEFQAWLQEGAQVSAAPMLTGPELLDRYGCLDCHTLDGSEGVGPGLGKIGGKEVSLVLPDGTRTRLARDEAYLRRAILDPSAELVKDWEDLMFSYDGEIPEEDLEGIVSFLMTGQVTAEAAPAMLLGQKIADEEGCLACHTTDGTDDVGPSFKGLAGSMRRVDAAAGGTQELLADILYLTESIVNPSALISEGFDDGMPSFENLTPDRLKLLVEWLASMRKDADE
ncbi:MAG: cytochrome c oxidase subunit II [Proteobacteria bacterium]|nr:cytochrome c oxidase subunit II [Pseudomonadota bacterium]MBU1611077.1 cytochrome c oxidase subunit II [Pseudomonadota bacterium]